MAQKKVHQGTSGTWVQAHGIVHPPFAPRTRPVSSNSPLSAGILTDFFVERCDMDGETGLEGKMGKDEEGMAEAPATEMTMRARNSSSGVLAVTEEYE